MSKVAQGFYLRCHAITQGPHSQNRKTKALAEREHELHDELLF